MGRENERIRHWGTVECTVVLTEVLVFSTEVEVLLVLVSCKFVFYYALCNIMPTFLGIIAILERKAAGSFTFYISHHSHRLRANPFGLLQSPKNKREERRWIGGPTSRNGMK